jgi:hypothetical protein
MATPRVSTRLPIYDPSKSNLAYGDRALPKLVTILLRQKFTTIMIPDSYRTVSCRALSLQYASKPSYC